MQFRTNVFVPDNETLTQTVKMCVDLDSFESFCLVSSWKWFWNKKRVSYFLLDLFSWKEGEEFIAFRPRRCNWQRRPHGVCACSHCCGIIPPRIWIPKTRVSMVSTLVQCPCFGPSDREALLELNAGSFYRICCRRNQIRKCWGLQYYALVFSFTFHYLHVFHAFWYSFQEWSWQKKQFI